MRIHPHSDRDLLGERNHLERPELGFWLRLLQSRPDDKTDQKSSLRKGVPDDFRMHPLHMVPFRLHFQFEIFNFFNDTGTHGKIFLFMIGLTDMVLQIV
jgi:hypothetical protein